MKREIIGQGVVVVLIVAIVSAVVGGAIGYVLAPAAEVPSDIAELQATIDEQAATISEMEVTIDDLESELAAIPPKPFEGLLIYMCTYARPGDAFQTIIYKGAMDAGRDFGCEVVWTWNDMDVPTQITQIREGIAMGADGIGIKFGEENSLHEPVHEARQAGIPVLAFNVLDPHSEEQGYIGQTDFSAGEDLAKYVVEKGIGNLKSGDTVLWVTMGLVFSYSINRSNGLRKVFDPLGIKFEYLDATWEVPEAKSRVTAWLTSHDKPKLIIYDSAMIMLSVQDTLEPLGYTPGDTPVVGFDLTPEMISLIKDGWVQGTIDQEPYLQGYLTVLSLCLAAKYEFKPLSIDVGGFVVDTSNIDFIAELIEEGLR
jgi:simple sugar transport system substrate-binding protein